ncbi:MAG TPA: methyltransferase domain-containing protein [Burkholderiales bacterium]
MAGPFLRAAALVLAGAALGCNPDALIMATYRGTPPHVARAMLQLADVGPEDVVYDLGSGDGRIVIMAAKEFGARGVGYEINPALIEKARAKARAAGVEDRVQFIQGDLFAADLRPATVVTLYLFDTLNLRLRPKLQSELAPGSRVVSHRFDMGDWKPDAERRVDDESVLYLWRIGETGRAARMRR